MNDRSATVRSTGPPMASGVNARTLVRSSTRTRSSLRKRPGQLPVADVDRDHLGGARAQQHVGEPAGRSAGVQAAPARDRDLRERVERAGELVPAARGVARIVGVEHSNRRVCIDGGRRLAGRNAAHLDPAGAHQLHGLLPGTSQTPADEFGIEPLPSRGHRERQPPGS